MAFVLSGNTITQSGTDTPSSVISGIGAIAGVTSASFSTYTQLNIPYKLNITGTMTTDSTVKFSMTRGGTFANEITIANGATWTAKEVRNLNGYNYYYQLPSLDFNNAALSGSTFSSSSFNAIIVNGGTLDLANIIVNGNGGHWWNGGTIRFRDVTFNAQNLSSVADTQFTTQSGTPTLDIIGWKVIGGKIFIATANITNFKGVTPQFMQRGFGTNVNNLVLQDFTGGAGNYGDLSAYANPNYEARNLGIGTSTTYFPWISGEVNSRGTIRATSDIDLAITNNLGSSVSSFISYLKDNATGAPTGFTTNNYYINTATSGTLSQRILIGVLVASAGVAASFVKRSATQTNDLYSFYIFDYNHNILSTQAFNLAGTGVKSASAIALVDNNVTLTKANALAKLASSFSVNTSTNTITVTNNSTLDDVYDAMKAFKCQAVQANLEYPTIDTQPVNASGNSIITAMNIVVNSGVALSVGTKFNNITASGSFTLNGSIASGISVTSSLSQATPTNLNGVVIDGNLTYNTNTPITVTFTDCTISGTVSNSGTGLVTISLSNTTIGTVGSNIATRPVTSLNLTGLTAGSQIYVADGLGNQIAYVGNSGTSYTLDTTGQTGVWSVKVARYGYIAQTGSHLPAIASTTLLITLIPDASITQATKATVAAYTTLANLDKLYDYSAYYETTNEGIVYPRVITKAGTSASANSYNVTLNNSGSVWSFNGSDLSIYSTFTLAGGTTITGSLFTSGTVTLTGAQSNTAITGNVLQSTPTNLSGMVITGNLTYNTGSASTVTLTNSTVTGTISNSGAGAVKVLKAGTSGWFTAGTNVIVRANVSITTSNNLALSTYILKNGSTDLGWVAENTARSLEIAETDTFSIYAIAYGYKAKIVSATATNTSTFQFELLPETFIDTTLNATTRNFIATKFSTSLDAYNRIALALDYDLRTYLPSEVMNAVQYYITTQGSLIAQAVIYGGTIDGVEIIQGGLSIGTAGFYGKVNDSVTTTNDLGILVPISIEVLPSVYVADPTYTPVKKNTSGIVLQYAPWTKQTADISSADKSDIATASASSTWNYTERTLNKALFK